MNRDISTLEAKMGLKIISKAKDKKQRVAKVTKYGFAYWTKTKKEQR